MLRAVRGVGWAALAVVATTVVSPGARAQAEADTTGADESTLVPLPVVFYTPETELGFGAIVIYYFRPGDGDAAGRPSSFTPLFIATTKSQILARLGADVYLGRWRVGGGIGFSRFPNTFWGIGNDTPEDAEEDYTPRAVDGSLQFQRRLGLRWYVGGTALSAYRELLEVEEGGLLASGSVPGANDGRVVAVGVVVTHDSRDATVFPRVGGLHEVRWAVYDEALGSDYDLTSTTIDLRQYVSTFRGQVLAVRGLGVSIAGVAPFDLLPGLGRDQLLRGYFAGRYRDRNLIALQAEYRVPVWKRFGFAIFGGTGQVAPHRNAFRSDRFHFSGGLGLRFALSPSEGLNLRLDRGLGEGDASGFYMSLGEAY